MPRASRAKSYIVRNPKGIPQGVHIISWGDAENPTRWYEGDDFTPPSGMNIERLLAGGYIEEKSDG